MNVDEQRTAIKPLQMESQLAGGDGEQYHNALSWRFGEEHQRVSARLAGGVPPDQYQQLLAYRESVAAAGDVIEHVRSRIVTDA